MFFSALAQAGSDMDQIQMMLEKPEVLCGNFKQQKNLIATGTILNSSGRFCVHTGKGVLWRTLRPVQSIFRLTKNEIAFIQENRVVMRKNVEKEPVAKLINDVVLSLISSDLTALSPMFDIDSTIRNSKWTILLKPHDSVFSRRISSMTINGDTHINHIVIKERSGDSTSIAFSNIETGIRSIKPDELKLYE
jgi:hypothetical protein